MTITVYAEDVYENDNTPASDIMQKFQRTVTAPGRKRIAFAAGKDIWSPDGQPIVLTHYVLLNPPSRDRAHTFATEML
jgi:hypothetical protein